MTIDILKPTALMNNTDASLYGSLLTYNEAGITYNEVGRVYGGLAGGQYPKPNSEYLDIKANNNGIEVSKLNNSDMLVYKPSNSIYFEFKP